MATEKLVVLQETDLTNNCTECFNQELRLTFYQKHRLNQFFHKITNEVTHGIRCKKCGSHIYPSKWTDDIERIFTYYEKMVQPEKAKITYSLWFYLLLLGMILAGVLIYLYLEGIIAF